MDAVVEVAKILDVIDSIPGDRSIGEKTLAHGPQHFAVCPYLGVAIHAGSCRWNACKGGDLYGSMAEATIDPELADMMLVAKLDRLHHSHIDFRCIRRPYEQ